MQAKLKLFSFHKLKIAISVFVFKKKSVHLSTKNLYMKIEISKVADLIEDWIIEFRKPQMDGLPYFSDELGDIKPGELHLVGGHAGNGKSAFLITQALHTANKNQEAVLYFGLNLTKDNFIKRLVSQISQLSYYQIYPYSNLGEHGKNLIEGTLNELNSMPLYFSDNKLLNIMELKNTICEFVKTSNIKLVIIDYLQLIPSINLNNPRDRETLTILKVLKEITTSLQISILISSQMNSNERTVPLLNDFDHRTILEQFADKILLVYRPEYYAIQEFDDGSNTDGKAQIIIAHNRFGKTEKVQVNYCSKRLMFY